MKKKLLHIIPVVALLLLLLPPVTIGQTDSLAWDYDISAGFGVGFIVDPLCSPARPDVCVTGFDLAYTVGGGTPIIAARVPVSACVLQPGSTFLYTCSASTPVVARYGNITWTARAIAKDGTAEIPSVDSNSVQVVRQPRPPAGLRTP